jgi:hypothetical protein
MEGEEEEEEDGCSVYTRDLAQATAKQKNAKF